jgi:polyferredoxin
MTTSDIDQQPTRVIRFRDSSRNWARITTIRVIVQTLMFGLFVAFVVLTTFTKLDHYPGLRHWVSKLLEIDPLVSISTALTTHTVYKGLLWSLIILIPTLFLGRFFCGWVCPYGSLHHFVGWLFSGRSTSSTTFSSRCWWRRCSARCKSGCSIRSVCCTARSPAP